MVTPRKASRRNLVEGRVFQVGSKGMEVFVSMMCPWGREEKNLDENEGWEQWGVRLAAVCEAHVGLQEQEARNARWLISVLPWLHLVLKAEELSGFYHSFIL